MKIVKNLIKSEKKLHPDLNKERFEEMCEMFGFIKGEYKDLDAIDNQDDLSEVFSHMYMFKNEEGKKYYVANTHAKFEEMVSVLLKYDLLGDVTVVENGFWKEDTSLVVVKEKTMKKLVKTLEK